MYTDNKEVFSNTCGKIFQDRIILATHKETIIPFRSIKSIALKKEFDKAGLLFTCLPAGLIAFPFIFTNESTEIKALFAVLGVLGVIICAIKIRPMYSLYLKTESGRKVKIKVWEGNKKEAQKFIDKATSMISRAKTAPEKEYAGKPVMA